MSFSGRPLRFLGIILFLIGVVVGLALAGSAAWADHEASLFDIGNAERADGVLRPFTCPVLITTHEVGTVRTSITNSAEHPREFTVRTNISAGSIAGRRQDEQVIPLEPGQTAALDWQVEPEDAAWNRVIMIRLYAPRNFSIPPRTASCGILVIDAPVASGMIVAGAAAISLIGMLGGLGLWISLNRPLVDRRQATGYAMMVVLGIVALSLLFSFLGLWQVVYAGIVLVVLVSLSTIAWALS